MTDEKLDQILGQALSPEIEDSEILIRRKDKHMNKKKIIVRGLITCAVFALVVTGIHFMGGFHPGSDTPDGYISDAYTSDGDTSGSAASGNNNIVDHNEERNPVGRNLFAITAYAAELPEGISSGDVIGLKAFNAGYGSSAYLNGRFAISGENIDSIKITTDKCNIYSALPIYENDPEFNDAKNAVANGNAEEYVMIPDYDPDLDEELKYHYEHLTIEGSSYEGDYNSEISFGMSVPPELWSSNEDMQKAAHEDVDQVNGATLTIEVTFTDGSIETHHYKLVTGKIFVPCDDNGYLQWDNLTRFVSSEEESYAYGYLMEKID